MQWCALIKGCAMPQQTIVAEQLADILSVIAHPQRIRVIEELGAKEVDVHSLADRLSLRQSTLSQHLAQLRSKGIVVARRDGRVVRYSLASAWLARWLVEGVQLLDLQNAQSTKVAEAVRAVKRIWRHK
jgi:DNA-binding transcriptional ArsR family regulator